MKTFTEFGLAILITILVPSLPTAHAGMMKKEKMTAGKMGMMEGERTAMLTGAGDHHAAGMVTLHKDMRGRHVVTLTKMKIDKVPDGRVYLAKGGDYQTGVEIGKLEKFKGMVEWSIPEAVNPADYDSVVVWCKKFNVEIGRAMFDAGMGMMEKGDIMR